MSVASGSYELQKQYVCFVKRRMGHRFVPYTEPGKSDTLVVKTLREFLDHEISVWFKASEDEKAELRVLLKVSFDAFRADVDTNEMNSKFAALLGWNYSVAARLVEKEGSVFLLTAHPRFQSIPFSFRRVCDDDDYALLFVNEILSIRGGEIAFEEYDPAKHVAGYKFGGVSDV